MYKQVGKDQQMFELSGLHFNLFKKLGKKGP